MIKCFSLFISLALSFEVLAIEAVLPLFQKTNNCGDIKVEIDNEEIKKISKRSLLAALSTCTNSDLSQISNTEEWISIKDIPFEIKYDPVELLVRLSLQVEDEQKQDFYASDEVSPRIKAQAITPAGFSGAINYRIEQEWADTRLGDDRFGLYLDNFINIKGVVLESEINYRDSKNSQSGWFRGDTRLIKDLQDKEIRLQAGDVYPQSFGFMQGRPIGGISAATDFTLNPYTLPFPQGQGSFILRSRSNVKTWVNNVLIKDEVLPAGNYDLREIPLINGLNKVVVEATDESGQKKIFQFNLPTSSELLNQDKWRFSLSSGVPFRDTFLNRNYDDTNFILTSGFVQYGLTKVLTLGAYSQQQSDFYLLGSEVGLASNWGNFFIGVANSKDNNKNGSAAQLSWQLQSIGAGLFNTYSFILRQQYLGQNFSNTNNTVLNRIEHRTQGSITLPIKQRMTLSLGANFGVPRDQQYSTAIGYDSTISLRVMRNLNLSLFLSKTKDELRNKNDSAYLFLTWTFDGSGDLVNGFHDFQTNTTRVTAIKDNVNKLYEPRYTANIEKSDTTKGAELDAFMPMPFADIGASIEANHSNTYGKTLKRGSVRLASAFTFAKNEDDFAFEISRPVPNSFVIFKPADNLKDQTLALRSTSPYNESSMGPFGQLTYNNLLPYQYREIQIDPSGLEDGLTLEQERYVVYPTYKSTHLIKLKDKGTLILKGQLVDSSDKPYSLKVGEVNGQMFFTDRSGYFFIQTTSPGEQIISLRDSPKTLSIQVEANERGVKDLGVIRFDNKEKRQ